MQKTRNQFFHCISAIIILCLVSWYFFLTRHNLKNDPDYFYHLGLSKIMQVDPLPRTLPQIEGIGWGDQFTDKEFLFHQITSLAYRMGGESGFNLVPLLLFFVTLGILALGIQKTVKPVALLCILIALFTQNYFLIRLDMVRPHTLAIPVFLGLFISLRSHSKWSAGIFSALFALSYHGLQVPLLLFLIYGFFIKRKDPLVSRTLLYGLVGLAFGLLLNPYYPGVLFVAWQHVQVAFELLGGAELHYGNELVPWQTSFFLKANLFALSILALAIHLKRHQSFTFLSSLAFWALACLSPRAQEYSIPLTALLLAEIWTDFLQSRIWYKLAAFGLFGFQLYGFFQSVQGVLLHRDSHPNLFHELATRAVKVLPEKEKGSLVFNCEWDLGPYVFQSRPNLHVLDLLDPSFLYRASKQSHELREELSAGLIPDTYSVLKDYFNAKYVFCGAPQMVSLMEHDPRFVRLFPDRGNGTVFLYQLKDQIPKHYLAQYDRVSFHDLSPSFLQRMEPSDDLKWSPADRDVSYIDFKKEFYSRLSFDEKVRLSKAQPDDPIQAYCHWVRPRVGSLDPFLGSTLLGVGGGPNVRVWINRKMTFQNRGEILLRQMVNTLIPLPHPLKSSDQIEAMVCAKNSAPFAGASLSFWTEKAVDDFCVERKSPYRLEKLGKKISPWKYWGNQPITCLAPLAIEAGQSY